MIRECFLASAGAVEESRWRWRIAALVDAGDCKFSDVLDVLSKSIDETLDPAARQLRLFLRHLVFLMENGEEGV